MTGAFHWVQLPDQGVRRGRGAFALPSIPKNPAFMILSSLFHICSWAVIPGWLLLIVAPGWRWTQRITTFVITVPLAALYMGLFAANWNSEVSFASLDRIYALFQSPAMLLAGWIHYLAFDLFIGSWEARDAKQAGIPRLLVIPCLAGTFLVGPVGLLFYLLIRLGFTKRMGTD
jgi:predicted ferric reductase